MGKGIIIFLIFLILLGIGGYLVYKYRDIIFPSNKPEEELRPFYIMATDDVTKDIIIANITFYCNHSEYKTIQTNSYGFEEVNILKNCSLVLYNKDDNKYYSDIVNVLSSSIKSSNLELYKVGDFIITQDRSLEENNITLNITTNSQIRKIAFCFTWTISILDVNVNNYREINPPERLKGKVMKCYDTDTTILKNDILDININYRTINNIQTNDKITIYFMDKNKVLTSVYPYKEFRIEENGRDMAAKDYIFEL